MKENINLIMIINFKIINNRYDKTIIDYRVIAPVRRPPPFFDLLQLKLFEITFCSLSGLNKFMH